MKIKKECNIVEDLLPAYIDCLLSEESLDFVKTHLETCENCQKTHQKMTSDLQKEDIENTENIKIIKKYTRKIKILKTLVAITILAILGVFLSHTGYRYYIVKNALTKNINYNVSGNYRLEEYDESIERYEYHTTTYWVDNKMKKVKGNEVLEYWEDNKHYFMNNDNKTYFIKNENIHEHSTINIPILILSEMKNLVDDKGIRPISILQFIFDSDITIQEEGFRGNTKYYVIKDMQKGIKIYFNQDTFFAERIVESTNKTTEYRILPSSSSWHDVLKPDLSTYTLIEKEM
ncbi:MAG: hypothetical protein HFJ33_07500 [Clostridia bacterium]|nr:hypothetical protein [Clostridia bacterium]